MNWPDRCGTWARPLYRAGCHSPWSGGPGGASSQVGGHWAGTAGTIPARAGGSLSGRCVPSVRVVSMVAGGRRWRRSGFSRGCGGWRRGGLPRGAKMLTGCTGFCGSGSPVITGSCTQSTMTGWWSWSWTSATAARSTVPTGQVAIRFWRRRRVGGVWPQSVPGG
jgi:hypothetical protein